MTHDLTGALILWGLASLITCACLSGFLMAARAERERRTRSALAAEAADHGEPARADVEDPWLLVDPDATPNWTETAAHILRSELDDDAAVGRWLA